MKKCSKCSEKKEVVLFSKNKNTKDGYSSQCKECAKKYHQSNREHILEKQKEYYLNNREAILQSQSEYHQNNKEVILERQREYYDVNKDKILKNKDLYRIENKDSIKINKKEYYDKNRDVINERNKKHYIENKNCYKSYQSRNKDYRNTYSKNRRLSDEVFKLSGRIRNLILYSFLRNGFPKNSKTQEILGCSFVEFVSYIESKFETWMNWSNHGKYNGEINYGWDIDHIIPISSAKTEKDVIKLNHYSNFQPLCSYTNRHIKGSKTNYTN